MHSFVADVPTQWLPPEPVIACMMPFPSLSTHVCCRFAQDPYANYVLQSALSVSSAQLHNDLVDAMRPYLPSLRGTPHGKRILSKINVKI